MVNTKLMDFKNFLYMAWKHLNLPQPTPVQYDIANYLQDETIKREVIEAFRGVGKSWITSAYVCHQLLLNPQMNILVVSASKTRSDDFSTFTLRLIHEMPILAHLRPREGQRMSKISFDVAPAQASHAPSVKSLGITGQLTGSRADLIIADDVESANNSQTQMMRDKLAETIKEFEAIIKPGGRIVFLGTPQTEMSIYNLLDERGYKTRIWPARYPDDRLKTAMSYKLAPLVADVNDKTDQPTDPDRFDKDDLFEREASYGKSGFALQFMLDVSLSDANKYPLKVNDFMVMSGPSSWTEGPVKVQWASGKEQLDAVKH
ncbi:MAG: phage terminase large subunit, partial [Psychrobacter sp.]